METTKEQLQERMRQWKLVNEREKEELRTLSFDEKAERLWTLMMLAREMGWDEKLREEEEQVRARWNKLREIYGVI